MFWCVKKAWAEKDRACNGFGFLETLWIFFFLMWVVSCQAFNKGRSHTQASSSGAFDMWIDHNFLGEYFVNLVYSKWLLWVYFLIGQGVLNSKWFYKLRKTAPKLEFNKTLNLFPDMEMCSAFKLFPAFLQGNVKHRVFIRNSIKSLKKCSFWILTCFLMLIF